MDMPSADSARRVQPDDVLPSRCDLYYGGKWHAPRAGRYGDTIDPAKGQPIARVAHADANDADAAVVAALTAAGSGLHPSDIAVSIAPNIGVAEAAKLESRVRAACARLVAAGTVNRVRSGRRFVFSI